MQLRDRHVVLTGAGGGLGRSLCKLLVAEGARVTALDLARPALDALADSIGSDLLHTHRLDVTDGPRCEEVLARVVAEGGPVDLLINNAGITHFSSVEETRLETLHQVMAVNFSGAVNCTKPLLPALIERRGTVVAISSVAGFAPLYGRAAYAASKHALVGFFSTLRTEVEPRGARVLIVCPSFIDTQAGNPSGAALYPGTGRPGQATRTVGRTMSSDEAARAIVDAIERDRRLLLLGRVAKVSWWLSRLLPGVFERIMARRTRAEVGEH
ncbi:MAG: SDR family oxidoreductase [Deltaproteobacteria bacterium]|nr:SDR family oxidoreductase [Deltaproteobacteria bacterium]